MDYFSKEYKKLLADHYVLDSWQFVINTYKNISTAKYCYDIIEKSILKIKEEHNDWIEGINEKINESIKEKQQFSIGFGNDDIPKYKYNIIGIDVSYPFLIDKYLKDFFQYSRNAFDSIAQIANSALLGNRSKNIEKVDFTKICEVFNKSDYSEVFPKTLNWFESIKDSEEFNYINEFNNRIKHICDARVIISQSLISDDITNKIDSFYKKGKQFNEQDICTITKSILDFLTIKVCSFLDVLTQEMQKNAFAQGRFHKLYFYIQQVKDDANSTFSVVFIEVQESLNELPDIISILLVAEDDEITSVNCDYDEILVKNKDNNYIGKYVIDEQIIDDGLLRYRKYKKVHCDGRIAFIENCRKCYSVKPYFMTGEIVRVGFTES